MKTNVLPALLGAAVLLGCGVGGPSPPGPAGEVRGDPGGAEPLDESVERSRRPEGRGTLREAEVSLSLRDGDLVIRVVPLEESVIRLTAPDTYRRLRSLATTYGADLGPDGAGATLFLVSIFSRSPGVEFEPQELNLVDRARRFRPVAIRPVTPGWGGRRLPQEEVRTAVYAFAREIDLESAELVVTYRGVRSFGWGEVLRRLEVERTRVGGESGDTALPLHPRGTPRIEAGSPGTPRGPASLASLASRRREEG